jgi:hypothetical protein
MWIVRPILLVILVAGPVQGQVDRWNQLNATASSCRPAHTVSVGKEALDVAKKPSGQNTPTMVYRLIISPGLPLVNIQPDVIPRFHGGASLVFLNQRPLSSAFPHQALLLRPIHFKLTGSWDCARHSVSQFHRARERGRMRKALRERRRKLGVSQEELPTSVDLTVRTLAVSNGASATWRWSTSRSLHGPLKSRSLTYFVQSKL